jgi:hypothetical protein
MLGKCASCEHEVDINAEYYPKCGRKNPTSTILSTILGNAVIICIAIAIFFAFFYFYFDK